MSWIRTDASKPIKVEVTTHLDFLLKYFPPVNAKEAMPEWLKKMPARLTKTNETMEEKASFSKANVTIRMCDGIHDLMRNGIILPSWSDIRIVLTPDESLMVTFAGSDFQFEHHAASQHSPLLENFRNLKLVSPWHIKCNEDIKWIWMSALYHNQLEGTGIVTPQAMVSYRYQCGTNVNLMLPFSTERELVHEIDAGTPLAQIVPLSNRPIELTYRYLPYSEWVGEANVPFAWHNYKRKVAFWKAKGSSPFAYWQ